MLIDFLLSPVSNELVINSRTSLSLSPIPPLNFIPHEPQISHDSFSLWNDHGHFLSGDTTLFGEDARLVPVDIELGLCTATESNRRKAKHQTESILNIGKTNKSGLLEKENIRSRNIKKQFRAATYFHEEILAEAPLLKKRRCSEVKKAPQQTSMESRVTYIQKNSLPASKSKLFPAKIFEYVAFSKNLRFETITCSYTSESESDSDSEKET